MSYVDLNQFLSEVLTEPYFTGEPPVIPVIYKPGQVPLVVVVGPNAGGKSLFRKLVQSYCGLEDIDMLAPSMAFRTQPGMARVFVYGDESHHSTGNCSVHSILGGIRTCRGRTTPTMMFWDEPDVGLSDGYAKGAGRTIADFVRELPATTRGVFVVSHRKALLRPLADLEPHYLHLGEASAPATLKEWLDTEEPEKAIDTLSSINHAKFLSVEKILDSIRREKEIKP